MIEKRFPTGVHASINACVDEIASRNIALKIEGSGPVPLAVSSTERITKNAASTGTSRATTKSATNVCKPFAIPALWTRFRSLDWGSSRPFSVGWWAVASDPYNAAGTRIPRGALVRYREWYGSTGKPNEGLKLTAEAVAAGIRQRDGTEEIAYGVADPSIFAVNGGPSIHEMMAPITGRWRGADNKRIATLGALSGWDQMRARIKGDEEGGAMLVVFDTCRDFIRTVPVMQHDPARPEDLDTDGEDHVADEARYACMSRPLTARAAQPPTNPADLGWRARKVDVTGWKVA